MTPAYENELLRIDRSPQVFSIHSKVTFAGLAKFCMAVAICSSLMVMCFGIATIGMQDIYLGRKLQLFDLVYAIFAGGGVLVAWVLHEACWEYLPKKFEVNLISMQCQLVTHGVIRRRFAISDIEFIGLRAGLVPGGAKGPNGYYSWLYIFKRGRHSKFRVCIVASCCKSYHEAFQGGLTVSHELANTLNVPLLRYYKKQWKRFTG